MHHPSRQRGYALIFLVALFATGSLFRSALSSGSRSAATALNASTSGGITVQDTSGNIINSQIVAVIFAPGDTLSGQDRSSSGSTTCGGNMTASNYLDVGPAP